MVDDTFHQRREPEFFSGRIADNPRHARHVVRLEPAAERSICMPVWIRIRIVCNGPGTVNGGEMIASTYGAGRRGQRRA